MQTDTPVVTVASDGVLLRAALDEAAQRTDHIRLWNDDGRAMAMLVDTNLLDHRYGEELVATTAGEVERTFHDGGGVAACFAAGRSSANRWLANRDVPWEERFVNLGLIVAMGSAIEFTGAYAPIYHCTHAGVARITFDATVCGFPELEGCDSPVGHLRLGAGERIFVLSDGMLESRTPTGRINGDSLLFRYWQERAEAAAGDGNDPMEEVWRRYQEADAQRYDSHGLLSIEPTGQQDVSTGRTLLLFKPDVYERDLAAEIERDLRALGLSLSERFLVHVPPEGVFHLWPKIYGRRWTEGLMRSIPRRPLDVLLLEGADAVERVIEFKDSLRESRAQINSYRNLLHSPDSPQAFHREYAYLRSLRTVAP